MKMNNEHAVIIQVDDILIDGKPVTRGNPVWLLLFLIVTFITGFICGVGSAPDLLPDDRWAGALLQAKYKCVVDQGHRFELKGKTNENE